MKKLTKLFALVLALALVLSLTACASKGIAGSWSYTLDMKKATQTWHLAGSVPYLRE